MRRYKNWAHQISSWKYESILRLVLPVFPRARNTSFLLSTLNSFQGYWKSTVVPAYDLILVGVDGKCQFVVDMVNLSFFFSKRVLLPLSFGNLHVSCHGGRPWIATLCFSSMFAGEISVSLFVSGQHFSGSLRDQRRLPTALGQMNNQVWYPHLSPLLHSVFLTNPGCCRCFSPGTALAPSLPLKPSWLYLRSV